MSSQLAPQQPDRRPDETIGAPLAGHAPAGDGALNAVKGARDQLLEAGRAVLDRTVRGPPDALPLMADEAVPMEKAGPTPSPGAPMQNLKKATDFRNNYGAAGLDGKGAGPLRDPTVHLHDSGDVRFPPPASQVIEALATLDRHYLLLISCHDDRILQEVAHQLLFHPSWDERASGKPLARRCLRFRHSSVAATVGPEVNRSFGAVDQAGQDGATGVQTEAGDPTEGIQLELLLSATCPVAEGSPAIVLVDATSPDALHFLDGIQRSESTLQSYYEGLRGMQRYVVIMTRPALMTEAGRQRREALERLERMLKRRDELQDTMDELKQQLITASKTEQLDLYPRERKLKIELKDVQSELDQLERRGIRSGLQLRRLSDLPQWKLDYLDVLLASLPDGERHRKPLDDLRRRTGPGREPRDNWEESFAADLRYGLHVHQDSIEVLIDKLSGRPPEASAQDALGALPELERTVLFVFAAFGGLHPSSFSHVVEQLLADRKEPRPVPGKDGETVERPMVDRWQAESHRLLSSMGLQVLLDATEGDRITLVGAWSRASLSAEFKARHRPWWSRMVQQVFSADLIFDESVKIFKEVADLYKDAYRRGDLRGGIRVLLRPLALAHSLPDKELYTTWSLRVRYGRVGRARLARTADLYRLFLREPDLAHLIKEVLTFLLENRGFDLVLELTRHLQRSPGFDEVEWLRRVAARGDDAAVARVRGTLREIVWAQAREDDRILHALESWFPAKHVQSRIHRTAYQVLGEIALRAAFVGSADATHPPDHRLLSWLRQPPGNDCTNPWLLTWLLDERFQEYLHLSGDFDNLEFYVGFGWMIPEQLLGILGDPQAHAAVALQAGLAWSRAVDLRLATMPQGRLGLFCALVLAQWQHRLGDGNPAAQSVIAEHLSVIATTRERIQIAAWLGTFCVGIREGLIAMSAYQSQLDPSNQRAYVLLRRDMQARASRIATLRNALVASIPNGAELR